KVRVGIRLSRTRSVGAVPWCRELDRRLRARPDALRRESHVLRAALVANREPPAAVELGDGRIGPHRLDGDVVARLIVRIEGALYVVPVVVRSGWACERGRIDV